jgi:cell division transport system ATP-binding protein
VGQIEFQRVTRRFDNGQEALKELSATFESGSMTFLTGHSGAGKSTFLKLLLCLDRPTRGQILVNGVNVAQLPARRLAYYRQHLGAVFQDHHLLAERTVYDNVALPLRVTGFKERDVARRVRAALTRVGLLAKEALFPRYLSTGEQQRVGIARAVVTRPKILLADEPTGNLDPELSRDIMQLFRQFHQIGTTVIVASHDRDLIESMGMRIIELSQGAMLSDVPGDPDDAAASDEAEAEAEPDPDPSPDGDREQRLQHDSD